MNHLRTYKRAVIALGTAAVILLLVIAGLVSQLARKPALPTPVPEVRTFEKVVKETVLVPQERIVKETVLVENTVVVAHEKIVKETVVVEKEVTVVVVATLVPVEATATSVPIAVASTPTSDIFTATPVPTTMAKLVNCPDAEQVQDLSKADVQKSPREPCGYAWSTRNDSAADAACPKGWTCTWNMSDGSLRIYVGPAQGTITAGTWRFVASYPAGDAVHNPCQLLGKERAFAGMEVTPGNFQCE